MIAPNPEENSIYKGHAFVQGIASGRLVASAVGLSFWGGVAPLTGEVIDRHHPLSGQSLQDTILAIPSGRGSCTGSSVMLELLLNGTGPKAVVFQRREDILTLGVIIGEELFNKAIPVVTLDPVDFDQLLQKNGRQIYVHGPYVSNAELNLGKLDLPGGRGSSISVPEGFQLSQLDKEFMDGVHGKASEVAMKIIVRMADIMGADQLIDVTQGHIDGCGYTGPASLKYAARLRNLGGRVRVPTTMNSISIDQKRWRSLGVEPTFGEESDKLACAYTDMGCRGTFTCAPYQLETAPRFGDQVAWAESNAVVYVNSVLGARTMKYPDFLDIAIALTGRAPKGGPHLDHNRLASLVIRLTDLPAETLKEIDDSFYPALGYHVGTLAPSSIPVIVGLENAAPSKDDLKAFGAAFATSSSAPMFHIVGVTPEATSLEAVIPQDKAVPSVHISQQGLSACWDELNCSPEPRKIGLVSLGNPHFSFAEIKKLAKLCGGRKKNADVSVVVTCGRSTHGLAAQAGFVKELEEFGVQFVNDTCWCMITDPIIPPSSKAIMTNSGKYAHYGPGLTGREFFFGSLSACVYAACTGSGIATKPKWLMGTSTEIRLL